nr:MAG TPA: hypothetical protein [Caudoviricetes sp.]
MTERDEHTTNAQCTGKSVHCAILTKNAAKIWKPQVRRA